MVCCLTLELGFGQEIVSIAICTDFIVKLVDRCLKLLSTMNPTRKFWLSGDLPCNHVQCRTIWLV